MSPTRYLRDVPSVVSVSSPESTRARTSKSWECGCVTLLGVPLDVPISYPAFFRLASNAAVSMSRSSFTIGSCRVIPASVSRHWRNIVHVALSGHHPSLCLIGTVADEQMTVHDQAVLDSTVP